MSDVAGLTQTPSPRLAEFVPDERFGDWRLKLYGLADPAKGVPPERSTSRASSPGAAVRRGVLLGAVSSGDPAR